MAAVFGRVLSFIELSSKLPNPTTGLAILKVGIVLFLWGGQPFQRSRSNSEDPLGHRYAKTRDSACE